MRRSQRSRSWKRVFKRVPSGVSKLFLKKEKPKIKRCANCKKPLHGVPRLTPIRLKGLSKSEKTNNRAFGGYYCSGCSRNALKNKVRVMFK